MDKPVDENKPADEIPDSDKDKSNTREWMWKNDVKNQIK